MSRQDERDHANAQAFDPEPAPVSEKRWTIYVCENGCGAEKLDPGQMMVHGKRCGGEFKPVEVMPVSESEQQLDELRAERDEAWALAERYSQDNQHWMEAQRNTAADRDKAEQSLAEAVEALRTILDTLDAYVEKHASDLQRRQLAPMFTEARSTLARLKGEAS